LTKAVQQTHELTEEAQKFSNAFAKKTAQGLY